ncbi:MAG: Crp/Fnr family transcriptional regulator, partial [Gammaproteobacteria bacterium]
YAVLSGKVQINVTAESGKELTFGIMNPGETFGEISVFNGIKRTATAKTLEQTELLVIAKRDLLPYLKACPDVAIKIIGSLCKRLTAFNSDMEDILFYDLPKRLAKKLVSLMKMYGKKMARARS